MYLHYRIWQGYESGYATWGYLDNFFLAQCVCSLVTLIINIMFGACGSISGHNFYMGTRCLDFWFTPAFKSYTQWSVSHTFVQGSHTCIFAMIYTSIETSPNVCIGKPCICREPACIAGLQSYATTVMGWFSDNFLTVSLERLKKLAMKKLSW